MSRKENPKPIAKLKEYTEAKPKETNFRFSKLFSKCVSNLETNCILIILYE